MATDLWIEADHLVDREDYTDWESVDEEEPEPGKKGKTKVKAILVKKETAKDERPPSATPEEAKRKDSEATRKREPAAKPTASRSKVKAGNTKTQKGLMNFFGPTKKT